MIAKFKNIFLLIPILSLTTCGASAVAPGGEDKQLAIPKSCQFEFGSEPEALVDFAVHDLTLESNRCARIAGNHTVMHIDQNIFLFHFDNQEDLARSFLRFQEFYESPKFKGKIFSLAEYQEWHTKEYGAFTYYSDWSGFNFPSFVLQPFHAGQFPDPSLAEQRITKLFADMVAPFYIIGTSEEDLDVLSHEIAHGLFYVNASYRAEVTAIVESMPQTLQAQMRDYILDMGYVADVVIDETQAYLGSDSRWLAEESEISDTFDLSAYAPYIAALQQAYRQHYTGVKGQLFEQTPL